MRPWQALRQPQRPCHTNRPKKPAVTLDCVLVSSFARFLVLPPPLTQFQQCFLSACSLCGPSIVAPPPKSFGRTFPRRWPLLRASIDVRARHLSRTSVETYTTSNLNRLVATGHSSFSDRLCPMCQFILRHTPRPIAPRPTDLENRSTMRSSSSSRNSSAPKRSKPLPLCHSSKERFRGVLWSCRQATGRSTTNTPYLTVFLYLHMFLTCLLWPLLADTCTLMRPRSSAPTLLAAPESSSALESHAPPVVALSAPPSSATTMVAAPLPALAALVAVLQALHAAPQVAAFSSSVPFSQAFPAATQPTPSPHSAKVLGGNCFSSSSGLTGSKGGAALLSGGPHSDPDDDPDKKKRDKEINN